MCNGVLQYLIRPAGLTNWIISISQGMRGKNTEELTYRGPDLKERDATRKEAGCKDGYCAGLIATGAIPANFNSCDEVSSLN